MRLVGHFNVGDTCRRCVKIDGPVTIVGTGDPTVASPSPSRRSRSSKVGRSAWRSRPSMSSLPANAPACGGRQPAVVRQGLSEPDPRHIDEHRYHLEVQLRSRRTQVTPLAGASVGILLFPDLRTEGQPARRGPDRSQLVEPSPTFDPTLADSQPVAIAFADFSKMTIVDNTFISSGEAEIEYSRTPMPRSVPRNNIVSNTVESPSLVASTKRGAPGYPAAIKVAGVVAGQVQVLDNHAVVSGSQRAPAHGRRPASPWCCSRTTTPRCRSTRPSRSP